jgi:hypothetical protein
MLETETFEKVRSRLEAGAGGGRGEERRGVFYPACGFREVADAFCEQVKMIHNQIVGLWPENLLKTMEGLLCLDGLLFKAMVKQR